MFLLRLLLVFALYLLSDICIDLPEDVEPRAMQPEFQFLLYGMTHEYISGQLIHEGA